MSSNFSEYKITLLLYIGVLLIPFGFFYTYSNVQESASDISIVRQLGQISTEILVFTENKEQRNQAIQKINTNFKKIEPWITIHNRSEFYVGGRTLQKDYNNLKQCWQKLSKTPQNKNAFQCIKAINSLSFIIDKMHTLKQEKIKNMFYISAIGTIIFLLLLIYLIRGYIHLQMKKHAIHDDETELFNQKYFMSLLHSEFSSCKRYKNPLSIISVSLDGFTDKTYDKKTKKTLMQDLGKLFIDVPRNSDITCRYDENHFAILLPLTNKKNASILENRLREVLESHHFGITPKINFSFVITEMNEEESEEAFIARTL